MPYVDSPQMIGGQRVIVQVWVDDAVYQAGQNEVTLRDRAMSALMNNADFLAIASPTNAEAIAQVRALTRQVNALIRLSQGVFDSTDGT